MSTIFHVKNYNQLVIVIVYQCTVEAFMIMLSNKGLTNVIYCKIMI